MRRISRDTLQESVRAQLWPVPLLAVVLAVVLGQLVPFLDTQFTDSLPEQVTGVLFGGGPEAARSLLETIASSMITVTSLTFSLTVVTLQLASSQFSPRLLRTFTGDRFVHNTLALFLATFVYALTVLRSIRVETDTDPGFVPEIAVTLAFVLTLASVVGLVLFLAHLAQQIRVETMLRDVHDETNRTLHRLFPDDADQQEAPPLPGRSASCLRSRSSGFLLRVDPDSALAAAVEAGAVVAVDTTPGNSMIEGLPYARLWSVAGTPLEDDAIASLQDGFDDVVRVGFERTATQDAGFGLQQMLDVASRALSPGVNDPTTAVHALSHLSAVLCVLAGRRTGPITLRDDEGRVRVVLARPTFEQLVDLVLDQLITYACSDARTARRTLDLLSEVLASLPGHPGAGSRRDVVLGHASRVLAAVDASDLEETLRTGLRDRAASAGLC